MSGSNYCNNQHRRSREPADKMSTVNHHQTDKLPFNKWRICIAIGPGRPWSARPLFGPCGPLICLARPLFSTVSQFFLLSYGTYLNISLCYLVKVHYNFSKNNASCIGVTKDSIPLPPFIRISGFEFLSALILTDKYFRIHFAALHSSQRDGIFHLSDSPTVQ